MSEQKVSGKTITHAWFRTTEMFKDDSVIGIAKQEWDDLDTRIDAALRRAKAEGIRMVETYARAFVHERAVQLDGFTGSSGMAGVIRGKQSEADRIVDWADARAAQIEEGEWNTARHRVDELEAREIDVEILQGDLTTLRQLAEAFTKTTKGKLTINRYEHGGGRMFVDDGKNRDLIADTYNEGDREFITLCYEVCATLAAKDAGKELECYRALWKRRDDELTGVLAQLATLQAQLRQVEGQSKQQAEEAVIVFAKYTTLQQLLEDVLHTFGYLRFHRVAGMDGLLYETHNKMSPERTVEACEKRIRATLAAQDAGKHHEVD